MGAPGEEITDEPRGAFVIYGADETIVLPVGPGAMRRAPGLHVLDERTGTVRVRVSMSAAELLALGVPECPCAVLASGPGVLWLDQGSVVLERPAARDELVSIRCWRHRRVLERPSTEDIPVATSLIGGRLEELVVEHSWGGGLNLYDALVLVRPLTGDTEPSFAPRGALRGCTGELDPLTAGLRAGPLRREGCESVPVAEAELHSLRRGVLRTHALEVSGGGASLRVFERPASPTRCPGPADPCGDGAAFRPLASGDERWVASSGRAALVARGRSFRIERPDGTSERAASLGLHASRDVIGVRYHDDVRELEREMSQALFTRAHPSTEAACAVDDDCAWRALCGASCVDGACVDGARAACPAGWSRVEGWCVPAERAVSADPRGRADGARCARAIEQRQIERARRACERGLSLASDPGVVGALLYNLGRVHEARGELDAARAAYLRSLDVRGDHPSVRARLAALAPATDARP